MNEDFGSDYLVITDDDGNEFELEHLETLEVDGSTYMAFLPADMSEDDEDFGLVLLKVVEEDDEDFLVSIDDEDELKVVYDKFLEYFSDIDEDEDEDADEDNF